MKTRVISALDMTFSIILLVLIILVIFCSITVAVNLLHSYFLTSHFPTLFSWWNLCDKQCSRLQRRCGILAEMDTRSRGSTPPIRKLLNVSHVVHSGLRSGDGISGLWSRGGGHRCSGRILLRPLSLHVFSLYPEVPFLALYRRSIHSGIMSPSTSSRHTNRAMVLCLERG